MTNEGIHRCIKFRSADVVKTFISVIEVVQFGSDVVQDEGNPHIRNTRDGTTIKLDANSGVCTMDMWVYFYEVGLVLSWRGTANLQDW